MKRHFKNLLSGKAYRRDALIFKRSKRRPKVYPKFIKKIFWGFKWPNNISRTTFVLLLVVFLSGYYPTLSFPPLNISKVSAEENNLKNEQKTEIIAASFPQPVSLPHPGYLSNRFSSWHPGVDIATGLGMPVHPITQGVVAEVNFGLWGYGNHVIVTHPNSFKSLYSHMDRVYAKKGQEVTTESTIGEVGMTGFSSGPHTHLEIIHDGKNINPLLILPEISDIPKPEFLTAEKAIKK